MAIHENYEDFTAGDATKTNWPQLPEAKRRKPRTRFFVDIGDDTVGEGKTHQLAKELALTLGGVVRPYTITEESLVKESTARRQRIQYGDYSN